MEVQVESMRVLDQLESAVKVPGGVCWAEFASLELTTVVADGAGGKLSYRRNLCEAHVLCLETRG